MRKKSQQTSPDTLYNQSESCTSRMMNGHHSNPQPPFCSLLSRKLEMHAHTHVRARTHASTQKRPLQHVAKNPCKGKKKEKERKSRIFNLTLFCYRAATVAMFLCSEATAFKAKPRTKAGLLLLRLLFPKIRSSHASSVWRAPPDTCVQLHNCTTPTEPLLSSF